MAKAIFIPADINEPVRVEHTNGLSDHQRLTGGWIQAAPIDRADLSLFINEEGKIENLPKNDRADALWEKLLPGGRMQGDYIAGDAVLVGLNMDDGEDADVAPDMLAYFQLT